MVLGNWGHHAYSQIGRGMPPTGGGREDRKRDRRVGRYRDSQPNRERQGGGGRLQREQTKRILKPQDYGPCFA